ncbi:MAG: GNAT family N-acyltransferase [Verrucomicrobiota bacterium]
MTPPQTSPSNLAREISGLSPDTLLATQGDLHVYLAPAASIPLALNEIGRLREISFQAVGEGTGNEIDLDHFDQHYLHLFLWDKRNAEHQLRNDIDNNHNPSPIAGAYRLAPTDRILAEFGPSGLYCSTLFDFQSAFLEHLTPALELGRSFVTPAYQKSLHPLLALWKGIASYVSRPPQYHRLFGPVSISQDYTPISQDLIVRFLRDNKWNRQLGPLVTPLNPFEGNPDISPRLESIDQVSARIAESESDGKGIPILLKQYLKLNATLLEFNRDPAFNNCLDALILVDLHDAPDAILSRYMGKSAFKTFRTQAQKK